MTRQEVKQLMAQIRAAWPSFYRDADADTLRTAMDLWAQALEQLTARAARRARGLRWWRWSSERRRRPEPERAPVPGSGTKYVLLLAWLLPHFL